MVYYYNGLKKTKSFKISLKLKAIYFSSTISTASWSEWLIRKPWSASDSAPKIRIVRETSSRWEWKKWLWMRLLPSRRQLRPPLFPTKSPTASPTASPTKSPTPNLNYGWKPWTRMSRCEVPFHKMPSRLLSWYLRAWTRLWSQYSFLEPSFAFSSFLPTLLPIRGSRNLYRN